MVVLTMLFTVLNYLSRTALPIHRLWPASPATGEKPVGP